MAYVRCRLIPTITAKKMIMKSGEGFACPPTLQPPLSLVWSWSLGARMH